MLTRIHSICSYLSDADSDVLDEITFDALCNRFHVEPANVDRVFYSLFGMSGEEIICRYREMLPDR